MAIRPFEHHCPDIAESAYVDEYGFVSGQVTIDSGSSVWPMAVLRGDVNVIRIGKKTNIQDGAVLHVTHASTEYTSEQGSPLVLGDEVTVGHNATLHACTIGNRCLIGMNAVVLDNAVLEDNVIVGAGSLVPPNKVLESGYLYIGSPVKQARALTEKEMAYFAYSAEHYVKLAQRTRT